jgi:Methionyl-tRNA formyltransferase
LQVACGTSSLIIKEIQRPGKKIQKSKEFLHGFSIPKETQLN